MILDAIGGISLGREIHEAFESIGRESVHIDLLSAPRKTGYKLRGECRKLLHRRIYHEDFYYYPKTAASWLQRRITQYRPEMVFVIGFLYRFVAPEMMSRLKKELNFKLVLYDTDSGNLFDRKKELIYFYLRELPVYDRIFSFSRTTTDLINTVPGLRAAYLPYGAKPIEAPMDFKKKNDIVFVGSADLRRIFLIEKLTRFRLTVYGSRWKRHHALISPKLARCIHHQTIWGNALHSLLHESKIILNITRANFYSVETGINLRLFEALAAGGFLLTDYFDELMDLFKIGEEIETYRSAAELVDKAAYYLTHDAQREKIARKGFEAFQRRFTWKARMGEMIASL